ncbi:hypothetical protein GOODEAATRI_003841, partial [Goodea atripinnis]
PGGREAEQGGEDRPELHRFRPGESAVRGPAGSNGEAEKRKEKHGEDQLGGGPVDGDPHPATSQDHPPSGLSWD